MQLKFVIKHPGVKITAVILAFLLWVHVVTDRTYEYTYELPFHIEGLRDGLMLASEVPDKCAVNVKGTGKQLLKFLVNVDEARMSVADYSTGLYAVDLSPADLIIDHKDASEILDVVSPRKLRLRIEERLEKRVPVVPDVDVAAAVGYALRGDLKYSPDSVTVSGPKRIVRKIKRLRTEHVTFTDMDRPLSEQVHLSFPDSLYLTLSDSNVLIKHDVIRLAERTFAGIPVVFKHSASFPDLTIKPESVSVIVEAVPSLLDSINVDQFSASITIDSVQPGSTFVEPRVTIPEKLRLIEIMPKEILIEVPRE